MIQYCKILTYRTRLSLSNQIPSQHGRLNSPLLNSRWFLETICVNTTKQLLGNFHTVEAINCLVPIGINVGIGDAARGGFPPVVGALWLFTVL